MADFDSADLLARFKLHARWPTLGEGDLTDAQIYTLLGDAQRQVLLDLSVHAPHSNLGAPTLLTSIDGGITYPFGTDADGEAITPLAVEVYASVGGRALYASSFGNPAGDFVIEATQIRGPGNRVRTYADGPYARWITPSGALDGATAPTLKPKHARLLIVYRALVAWANRGGLRDPLPYEEQYQREWTLVRDALKRQFATQTATAAEGLGWRSGVWWGGLVRR